jgi:hypothetical protein
MESGGVVRSDTRSRIDVRFFGMPFLSTSTNRSDDTESAGDTTLDDCLTVENDPPCETLDIGDVGLL